MIKSIIKRKNMVTYIWKTNPWIKKKSMEKKSWVYLWRKHILNVENKHILGGKHMFKNKKQNLFC